MSRATYPFVSFSKAVRDCTGGNCKIQRKNYAPKGEIPVIDQGQEFISGYTGTSNQYRGSLPVILFGDHTKNLKYIDFPFALGADGVKALEPMDGFDANFLHFFFRSIRLPDAGYSRHFKFLKEVFVPKPPLSEQRRIVDLLSRAEGIVRLRREAEKKAAELIPALFLDMFGDPATNPKGWAKVLLGDLCTRITDGTHQPPKFQESGIPFIFVANIVQGRLSLDASKFISKETYEELTRRCPIEHGDVLYSTVGSYGVPVKVDTNERFSFQRHIAHLKPNRTQLDSDFLVGMLATPALKIQADTAARGIAQKTINLAEIRKYQVIAPPIEAQRQFAAKVEAARSIQLQQSAATAKAQAAFNALLAQIFGN